LRLYPCVGIWILFYMDVFMSWWHGYLRCMLYFRCDVLLLEFFMHFNCELFEDVTFISWIFIIFALFIALIEVGRYNPYTASFRIGRSVHEDGPIFLVFFRREGHLSKEIGEDLCLQCLSGFLVYVELRLLVRPLHHLSGNVWSS